MVLHVVSDTVVYGADEAGKLTKYAWRDLKEGTEVAAHYTKRGTKDAALEIDKLGDEGLKESRGALVRLDQAAKTVVVTTARGAEETFRMTDHAAKSLAKHVAKGTEKGTKVTVYYAEDGGRKVVHFFERW
jgi:hypothetical protein